MLIVDKYYEEVVLLYCGDDDNKIDSTAVIKTVIDGSCPMSKIEDQNDCMYWYVIYEYIL